MFEFNALPQLAVGDQGRTSGSACIMNAIAWLEGDSQISDLPDCVWKPLAYLAQAVNDNVCQEGHPGRHVKRQAHSEECPCCLGCFTSHITYLCPGCSHQMWMIGVRLIGSAGANVQLAQNQEIYRRWAKAGLEAFGDRGGCPLMVEAGLDYLAGHGVVEDLSDVVRRHEVEHAHSDLDDELIRMLTSMSSPASSLPGSPVWTEAMIITARFALIGPWMVEQMNTYIDIFEEVTGFLATPPTPLEVKDAAERAGLVMV